MNIRKARLEDLDTIVEYNYNLAYETENKELDKEILTKGVRNIIQDENKGIYHVCEINGEGWKRSIKKAGKAQARRHKF